ncbi:unnamed protein product [Heligmosomoides polygyrus]|uniref:Uncharacterized protein n=1 Tax=Heligmosomoides polygyrus TaxID=6339 RepID=A0A183FFH4_HELPZ|nr:unnamed protein product [Heligmosomoides polygyrus]
MERPRVVDRGIERDRVLPRDAGGMQGMDSLLLLCLVDAFLVRGSGMFMHRVHGCVRTCADCNCVGPANGLHSVDSEYM